MWRSGHNSAVGCAYSVLRGDNERLGDAMGTISRVLAGVVLVLGVVTEAGSQEAYLLCKLVKEDTARLACFDAATSQPTQSGAPVNALREWQIDEGKAEIDDSPRLSAAMASEDGKAVLVVRCRERSTDVIVMHDRFVYCGDDPVRVTYRIDQAQAIEARWNASSSCRAVFATSPVPLFRTFNDGGRLFVRLQERRGGTYDAIFNLGHVSEVRRRIADACKWGGIPKSAAVPKPTPAPKRLDNSLR